MDEPEYVEYELSKVDQLSELLGEWVVISLKSTLVPNEDLTNMSNTLQGYLVNVSEDYAFIGPEPDEYYIVLDLNDVGVIQLSSEKLDIELDNSELPDGEELH